MRVAGQVTRLTARAAFVYSGFMSDAPAPASAPAAAEPLPPLSEFIRIWHDTSDEPYGVVFAAQEIFPPALTADVGKRVPGLVAAIREARAPERRDQPAPGL